jgi:hypothetical protein
MTTYNGQVNASGDDSYQVSGTPSLTALVINANGTSQWGAHIINNVTIPQGATITSAYVEPYFTSAALDDPNLSLYLENVDSPAALTTVAGDVSGRSLTTGVAWVASAVGTGFVQSPDITADVQTVVNRVGWVSGSSMNFISRGTALGNSRWAAYDTNPAQAFKVTINYTVAAGSLPPIRRTQTYIRL